MNKVIEVIKSRRSIRKCLPEQLKQGESDAILEAGLYAPSAPPRRCPEGPMR